MNKFKTLLFLAVFSGIGLWGCDDSSSASSNGPDENAAVDSSSSVCKDCEDGDGSSSSSKKIESSDEKDVGTSSDAKSNSLSSSSKKDDASSSSKRDDSLSSSSSYIYHECENGATTTTIDRLCTVFFSCVDWMWTIDSTVCAEKPKEYPVMDSLFETKYATYKKFEDPRDHQVYRTVVLNMHDEDGKIVEGEKIEVFAQNLNYGEMIDTGVVMNDDGKVEKYCDLNDEWFCNNGWGGRYTWSEAMALSAKYDSVLWKDTVGGDTRIHQGLCPEDWHIMNAYEWKNYTSTMGLPLASKVNWSPLDKAGANMSGLSVLFQMKTYKENWGNATFFLPTEEDGKKMYRVTVNDSYVTQNAAAIKHHNWFYVRCVRDY
ncbi:MAG: hypothetical protein IJ177_08085 [Fibrobacter sp.]|uniref:FISUMP domain-containing protein n=1 Tax=Fibrobacter sp. TaxID=35828 RepID=UPI0025BAD97A|nr:FISUMP domain-containing protein [Fibrobacter sp.]MBQ9226130.1 hypothetical protein [Fibrobacter sp.]